MLSEEMNSGNFGICLDTGHFNLFSKIGLREWIGIIRPYIMELHLHDNYGVSDDHLPPGRGTFDFKTLFEEILGIDCVYTLEAHSIDDVKESLKSLKKLTA